MAVIATVPEPNIWNEICKDVASMRPPFREDDDVSIHTVFEDYDAAKHTPVFYGDFMHKRVSVDQMVAEDFDPSISHPAFVGYALVSRPPPKATRIPEPPPDKCKCSPREYLEHYVFPILLPALEELLRQAKRSKCFERRHTKFNALDFLTEYLYRKNPVQCGRESVVLGEIPFVRDWWQICPRPPLEKSVLWSEAEAAIVIQSFWEGYKVRINPEVQELRKWQREWREENSRKISAAETSTAHDDVSAPCQPPPSSPPIATKADVSS